ncbi:hypothetical protein [Celeribacter sp. PS-C1]|uniref:hypothetical protein n=1 Tax=Celeribacter sp. PS-C1 TaxID=2820813 RepID=UPI001CA52323|nr:hypothetical protein [Celeribacter sp. PS-C1]MBW6416196.1 hypothetical protein [Celeribacter sp. PS-C1]
MRRQRRAELEAEKADREARTAHVIARLEAEKAQEEEQKFGAAQPTSPHVVRTDDQDWEEDDEGDSGQSLRRPPPLGRVPEPAHIAHIRLRHVAILASFLLGVILPVLLVSWYMVFRASDQYVSQLSFSVRTEEPSSALDILGGLSSVSSSSGTSDTDVLFKYLQSDGLVQEINNEIDLVNLWNKPERDPYYSFGDDHTIEALTDHWNRMVDIFYDSSAHILELRAHAFTPEDAQLINDRILAKSSNLVNELSSIAREDGTRYAREDLEQAVERLKAARSAIARFRSENLILDPSAESQSQMGLLNMLQQQLADAMVEHDMLLQTTNETDPRVNQVRNKIDVIRRRITAERQNFSASPGQGQEGDERAYAAILEEFESLSVDKEFAEQAYVSALASYDSALADAGRKTRYVAAHIKPTLPQRSTAPHRMSTIALFALFNFLLWSIAVLVFYALRDRR